MPDIHKGEAESYEANRSFPYWGTRGGCLVAGCASDDVNYLCSRDVGWRAGNSKRNYGDTRYGHCRFECHDSTICSGSSIQTAIDARTGPVRQINSSKLQNQRLSYRESNNVHKYFMLATTGLANCLLQVWDKCADIMLLRIPQLKVCFSRKRTFRSPINQEDDRPETATSGRS